jgi:hypothetical protein
VSLHANSLVVCAPRRDKGEQMRDGTRACAGVCQASGVGRKHGLAQDPACTHDTHKEQHGDGKRSAGSGGMLSGGAAVREEGSKPLATLIEDRGGAPNGEEQGSEEAYRSEQGQRRR